MHLKFPSQDTCSRPLLLKMSFKTCICNLRFFGLSELICERQSTRKNLVTFGNSTNSCNPNFGLQNQEGTCPADRIIENNSMSPHPCERRIFRKHVSFKFARLNLILQTIPPRQSSSLSDLVWDTDSIFLARQLLRGTTRYLRWPIVCSDMNATTIDFEDAFVLKPKNIFHRYPNSNKQCRA